MRNLKTIIIITTFCLLSSSVFANSNLDDLVNAVVNSKWKKCFVCGLLLNTIHTHEPPVSKDEVALMGLHEFAKHNLIIKVHSELLGKHICFVSNEVLRNEIADEDFVTYLPQELEHLIKVKATLDEIKKIHMIKELFPGSRVR